MVFLIVFYCNSQGSCRGCVSHMMMTFIELFEPLLPQCGFVYAWPVISHLDHIWWWWWSWWVVRIYKGGKPILRCTAPNVLGTWSSWWKRSIFSSCDGYGNGKAGNDFSLNCVLNDSHRRDGHVYLLVGNYFSDERRSQEGNWVIRAYCHAAAFVCYFYLPH